MGWLDYVNLDTYIATVGEPDDDEDTSPPRCPACGAFLSWKKIETRYQSVPKYDMKMVPTGKLDWAGEPEYDVEYVLTGEEKGPSYEVIPCRKCKTEIPLEQVK